MQRTFPAETIRCVKIVNIAGALVINGWDEQTINVECEKNIATLNLEGDTLIVGNAEDRVIISVPYETIIQVMRVSDDVAIVNVSQVELHEAASDCSLKCIHGNASLGRIHGDLRVEDVRELHLTKNISRDAMFVDVTSLKATGIGRDVICKNVHDAQLRHGIGGDLKVENVDVLDAGNIGRDCVIHGNGHMTVNLAHVGLGLKVHGVARLQVHNVGQSCEVYDSEQAEVTLAHIGSKLEIAGASLVQAQNIGRECKLRDIQGNVSVKHIGTRTLIAGVGGDLRLGHVGSRAEIRGVQGRVALGQIGGNLELQAHFPPESVTNLHVGGTVTIDLSDDANVTAHILAGGKIMDKQSGARYSNYTVLVYGDGMAQLKVKAGGSVFLSSPVIGRPTGENNWRWQDWRNWQNRQDWGEWGEWGEAAASIYEQKERKHYQRMEEQNRRKHEQRRRREERTRAARFKNDEWWVDSARIDRIVEQARQAAADGIQGAFEAVDQALKNMHLSVPPSPPMPHAPHPPMPPSPPVYPDMPVSPIPTGGPNGENERGETGPEEVGSEYREQPIEADSAPVDIDQERVAVLHMVAEGRITPDEGDMLLEALD